MIDLELVKRSPRSQYGVPRASVWNIAFPEGDGIRLPRYGWIPTDLSGRIPRARLSALRGSLNRAPGLAAEDKIKYGTLRPFLQDLEGSVLLWAADRDCDGSADLSDPVVEVLTSFSRIVPLLERLSKADLHTLGMFATPVNPPFRYISKSFDSFDAHVFSTLAKQAKKGRRRKGDHCVNVLVDALLEDWLLWTNRPITTAKTEGSAEHFLATVVDLLIEFPSKCSSLPLIGALNSALPELRRIIDAPLRSAIRSAAAQKSAAE